MGLGNTKNEVKLVAARLTDRQKKKIIADYVDLESYHAVARKHKIAVSTVKRICDNSVDMKQKATQKKEQNTQDILDYMELKKDAVTQVIGRYLEALLDEERISKASPAQITTALGTLIDKWTLRYGPNEMDASEDDPITAALKEEKEHGLV